MCGINILSDNLLESADVSITSGTVNEQYPLSNLQNESPAIKFRSTSATATLLLDMTVTRTVTAIALVGDPTETIGVSSVVVKGSVTTDFSGSTPITVVLNSEYNFGLVFPDSSAYRYWQVELTGTGSYVELSNLFIGEALTIDEQNFSISSFSYTHNDRSDVYSNEYDQRFIDKRNLVRKVGGRIDYANKTETDLLDEVWRRHGRSKPLWLIPDKDSLGMVDGAYKLSVYGYLLSPPVWKAQGGQLYTSSISVKAAV